MSTNKLKNRVVNERRGQTKHPLWLTWQGMKKRCYNKNDTVYHRYGGRGIKVCDRWVGWNGFWNFVEDMGERPEGCTLDRVDNDKDYCKENCRWANQKEQTHNSGKYKGCLRRQTDGRQKCWLVRYADSGKRFCKSFYSKSEALSFISEKGINE